MVLVMDEYYAWVVDDRQKEVISLLQEIGNFKNILPLNYGSYDT